jgi:hypothetical protein
MLLLLKAVSDLALISIEGSLRLIFRELNVLVDSSSLDLMFLNDPGAGLVLVLFMLVLLEDPLRP